MSRTTSDDNRDFPATSIGRSSGSRFAKSLSPNSSNTGGTLSRTSSRESLNIAHPLLSTSPGANSDTAWDNGFKAASPGQTTPLGYVPYTSKHRPPSSHITHTHPSTSASPSPSVLVTPAIPATSTQSVLNRNPSATGSAHDATSKLQLMNLKSAAQGLGLNAGSIGWSILERLVGLISSPADDREEEEWREIWVALYTGKATLLLPLDPLSSLGAHISVLRHERDKDQPRGSVINAQFISPALVKNHVVFCEPSENKELPTQIVTLSGLRGFITSTDQTTKSASIIFTTTLHPSTQAFKEIVNPSTRASGFSSLAKASSGSSSSRHPTYTLPTHTNTFTLPPRTPSDRKPPLPPRRPGITPSTQRPSTPSGNISTGGRLAGLVNLFGRSSSSSSAPASTDALITPSSRPPSILSTSDKASIEEDAGVLPSTASSWTVPAFSVSTTIHSNDVLKGLWEACLGEVKDGLNVDSTAFTPPTLTPTTTPISIPSLVVDRVLEFLDQESAFPVLRLPARTETDTGGSIRSSRGRKGEKDRYQINGYEGGSWRDIEGVADQWQAFYADLEDELRAPPPINDNQSPKAKHKRKKGREENVDESEKESLISSSVSESERNDDDEKSHNINVLSPEERQEQEEKRLREILERVENVVCAACDIYGRLFPQPSPQCIPKFLQSDGHPEDDATDSAHDEALASQIAALNLVDLGFADMDIETPSTKEQESALLAVLTQCGEALGGLEDAHSPKDKAGVLVKAHRILVDGLSNLSEAVRMRSQDEIVLDGGEKKEAEGVSEKPSSVLGEEEVMSPQEVPAPSHVLSPSEQETVASDPQPVTSKPGNSQHTLSLDTLFPLLILSVVKANPPRLISHLLYTQRFRNRSFGGEEAYCLVNLMAVAEFIGALDPTTIASNRLGIVSPGSGPIPIPAPNSRPGSRLSMIAQVPLPATPAGSVASTSAFSSTSFTLRHRVEQQVDALSNSANRVLTGVSGVMDTSFGLFKSLSIPLPPLPPLKIGSQPESSALEGPEGDAPWNDTRQVLVRRDTGGFSIRNLKLPGLGGSTGGKAKEEEMISVSRPGSVRSRKSAGSRIALSDESGDDESGEEDEESDGEDGSGSEADEHEEQSVYGESYFPNDNKSIKSFEKMMSSRRKNTTKKSSVSAKEVAGAARKSLSDRLAKVSSGIGGVTRMGSNSNVKPSSPASSSLLLGPNQPTNRSDIPVSSSRPQSPTPSTQSLRLAPPKKQFLEMSADDLRLKDVAELLQDYRRLVEGVRSIGGFVEEEGVGI